MIYNFKKILFKVRHIFFESTHRGYLKYLNKKYMPKYVKKYLLNKKLKKLSIFPETISIETTNICNAKCWFCSQPNSPRAAGYMDFDLYKKIIKEIKPKISYVKNIALFMDGDPTMHKGLVKYLQYASKEKIKNIYLSSNMEYFTPKLTNEILSSNLGNTLLYVICSLDGANPDIHRQNRINVDFEKAVKNTEYLIDQKKKRKVIYPWVFTRLLENTTNFNNVNDFKKYWKGKADKVLVTQMHNWGGQIKDKRITQYQDSPSFLKCYFPFSQLAIQRDGTTRICCVDTDGTALTGNLNTQTIDEIWNGSIQKKYRDGFLNHDKNLLPDICHDCTYPSKGQHIEPVYFND